MPAVVLQHAPQAHVLADSTKSRQNVMQTPASGTKRRHDGSPVTANFQAPPKKYTNGKHFGSSQPKSQFEEQVLEKLTQDINGLKQKNSEKDQQWERPALEDFNEKTQNLCFQQIDAEEGTLHGGKTTIKLFGATEVCYRGIFLTDMS